jgi:hypothetical protein
VEEVLATDVTRTKRSVNNSHDSVNDFVNE